MNKIVLENLIVDVILNFDISEKEVNLYIGNSYLRILLTEI